MKHKWITPGIPDSEFIRGDVPMTKEEVRTVVLAKLRLFDNCRMLDIGGGSGSVSVEAARLIPGGLVTVIEKEDSGISIIKQNCEKFQTSNVQHIQGVAPIVEMDASYDRIFIGGSGGKLSEIFAWCNRITQKGARIVITAITLETLEQSVAFFNTYDFMPPDIVQIAVTRIKQRASLHMLRGENPVFIISGEKK